MLSLRLFGVPVFIQHWFWITAFLLGGGLAIRGSLDWIPVFVSMVAILVSVIVHELGHALASRALGGAPRVILHGLGGLTYLGRRDFGRLESIGVSLAGPLAGFALALLAWALGTWAAELSPVAGLWTQRLVWIGVFWNLFNLLPILPMDGGQILREGLGPRHGRLASGVGAAVGAILAVVSGLAGMYLAAILLAFMAVGNARGTIQMEGGVRRE
jgi:Zn-dependent protease